MSAGRKAQFQDSFQKTQQERWDKEAKARKEEEKSGKRQNAMKYINSEGGITPDNFMEIKPYKNTYSDAAVRSAENMKNQLEKLIFHTAICAEAPQIASFAGANLKFAPRSPR